MTLAKSAPMFTEIEECDFSALNMTKEIYHEFQKYCFYLNIYNALILYKLAQIISIKPIKLDLLN